MKEKLTNKEISWLSFNARVLQEAADPTVPLLERIRFLGIFSSNLDEFFRVRVATLRRLSNLGKKAKKIVVHDPKKVLKTIQETTLAQHRHFDMVYKQLLKELAKERIFIIKDTQLTADQGQFVTEYFRLVVRPHLMPIVLTNASKFPTLRDDSIYLATALTDNGGSTKPKYALIEVPRDGARRFLLLPSIQGDRYIILLDDVIRYCLQDIFSLFGMASFQAYTIKVTRDAELDIEDDVTESYIRKVSKSLKQRKQGAPVRFVHDSNISQPLLDFLTKSLRFSKDDTLIPGSEYHNFKDFMKFPQIGSSSLRHEPMVPLPHKDIDPKGSLLSSIADRDILLHFPYQSFDNILALLREAAIDQNVTSIKIALYRVAQNSSVVNALINAVKNGKSVTAVVELQARFDEAANISLANRLQEEGVRVIYGVPGLKVHAKLCLITRKQKRKEVHYACIGTGNFNEDTTGVYSDHCLLTADKRLTSEVNSVFDFFDNKYRLADYKHLMVSPFNSRKRLVKLLRAEMRNAKKGKEAYAFIKLNNLADIDMIRLLYQASKAGVKIRLNVRGMFSLVPGESGYSENIEAIGIVDKFLEHSRIFVFANAGSPRYFLSSGDWMTRNLDRRVEVTTPIYDKSIQAELQRFMDIQWSDNVKARILNRELDNHFRRTVSPKQTRSQVAIYEYLKQLHTTRRDAVVATDEPFSRTAS
jgi:polyphosphate kinase